MYIHNRPTRTRIDAKHYCSNVERLVKYCVSQKEITLMIIPSHKNVQKNSLQIAKIRSHQKQPLLVPVNHYLYLFLLPCFYSPCYTGFQLLLCLQLSGGR